MHRPWTLLCAAALALLAKGCEAAHAAAPATPEPPVAITAADLQEALAHEGVKIEPALAAKALPAITRTVERRIELEKIVARSPSEVLQALDRDARKDGEAVRRAVDALATLVRARSAVVLTDARWRMFVGPEAPEGWQRLVYNDSWWKMAVDEGEASASPWGLAPDCRGQTSAHWIWHYLSNAAEDKDTVLFRRSFVSSGTEFWLSIAADNEYQAWLDGNLVGQGRDWKHMDQYIVKAAPGTHVLAVKVVNQGGPGGLVAEVR
jgi:hypothetical protein